MGLAVRNKSTGWISGWSRYDVLPHDPETEELVECESPDDLKPPEQVSAESTPRSVPMSSLRKALRRMLVDDARPELGYALPALEKYVEQDGDLYDELHYSPDVARGHATVAKLGRLFGWTDAKLDDLFRLAATL